MKNWLGDVLFQFPALELLHKKYPDAKITCIVPERCKQVLQAHPYVSEIILFDEKKTHRNFFSRIQFAWNLRKKGPWQEGYLFHKSRTRAFIFWLAGIKKRIGYGKGRSFFLTQSLKEPREALHQVDYLLEMMKRAGFSSLEEKKYSFYLTDEDHGKAQNLLSQEGVPEGNAFVGFHLGANWEPKRWPLDHFSKLADQINEKWSYTIVVTGSATDGPLFEQLSAKIQKARIVSLVGKTDLRVLGAVYKRAQFVVSSDSGPMHIASGVGTPIVAIFGPTNPQFTGPRGTGKMVILNYVPEGYQTPFVGKKVPEGWMEAITPEQVVQAIEKEGFAQVTV